MARDKKKKKNRVRAVGFGRNYFYCLSDQKAPWKESNNNNISSSSQASLPVSTACTAQSTVVVTDEGKVFQTGTLHGIVLPRWTHIPIPLPLKCVQISCGRHFCVARLEAGKAVVTWGAGHFSQLGWTHGNSNSGSGTAPSPPPPTFVGEPVLVERLLPSHTGSPVCSVAAGDWHALALTEAGHVWSWGSNRSLQCGIPNSSSSSSSSTSGTTVARPQPIPALPPMREIAAGRSHSLGLTRDDGHVYGWGSSQHGQCGTGSTTRRSTAGLLPTKVQGLPSSLEMIQIDAAGHHSVSLSKAGRVFVWGDGSQGQLGLSLLPMHTTTNGGQQTSTDGGIRAGTNLQQVQTSKPRLVLDLDFVAVAARHGNVPSADHHSREAATSADAAASRTATAEILATIPKIASVYAAATYTAAISSSGHVYCWGSNDTGQLGLPTPADVPWEIAGSDDPVSHASSSMKEPERATDRAKSPTLASATRDTTPERELHVRLFDSNHNVLLPMRISSLDTVNVQTLALGPNHMWCFGHDRNTKRHAENSDSNNANNNNNITNDAIGQTLHEAQHAMRERRLRASEATLQHEADERTSTLSAIKAKALVRLKEEKAELGLLDSSSEALDVSGDFDTSSAHDMLADSSGSNTGASPFTVTETETINDDHTGTTQDNNDTETTGLDATDLATSSSCESSSSSSEDEADSSIPHVPLAAAVALATAMSVHPSERPLEAAMENPSTAASSPATPSVLEGGGGFDTFSSPNTTLAASPSSPQVQSTEPKRPGILRRLSSGLLTKRRSSRRLSASGSSTSWRSSFKLRREQSKNNVVPAETSNGANHGDSTL